MPQIDPESLQNSIFSKFLGSFGKSFRHVEILDDQQTNQIDISYDVTKSNSMLFVENCFETSQTIFAFSIFASAFSFFRNIEKPTEFNDRTISHVLRFSH